MLTDEFLDWGVWDEKRAEWNERFGSPQQEMFCVVAENEMNDLVGFACTFGNEHEEFGSYLDNLHVSLQKNGIGSELLRITLEWTESKLKQPKLYLWVLEQNISARKFYEQVNGILHETKTVEHHGGGPVRACRYVWN